MSDGKTAATSYNSEVRLYFLSCEPSGCSSRPLAQGSSASLVGWTANPASSSTGAGGMERDGVH